MLFFVIYNVDSHLTAVKLVNKKKKKARNISIKRAVNGDRKFKIELNNHNKNEHKIKYVAKSQYIYI